MKKHSNPTPAPGPSLGDVARIKVLGSPGQNETDAMIGHPFFFPGEKVVERLQTEAMVTGSREVVFVTITSMPDPVGYPTMGRVLLSYNEEASVSYGGFFFASSYKKKCIQSVYLVEEYRGSELGALLAELAKRLKISCVFEPVSPAGRAWAGKHGFKIKKG